jgi:multisubunit Na+/H+ antiporter MnhF subunit
MDTRRLAVAVLMTLEAASLVVASAVHLSRSQPNAGIPEAVICVALAAGALAVYRAVPSWRTAALSTVGFAIAGFLVGLSVTARGHSLGDVAYHATVLPFLVGTLALAMPGTGRTLTARPRRQPVKPGPTGRG